MQSQYRICYTASPAQKSLDEILDDALDLFDEQSLESPKEQRCTSAIGFVERFFANHRDTWMGTTGRTLNATLASNKLQKSQIDTPKHTTFESTSHGYVKPLRVIEELIKGPCPLWNSPGVTFIQPSVYQTPLGVWNTRAFEGIQSDRLSRGLSRQTFACKNNDKQAILASPAYGPLLKDPELLFHGINLEIWKIQSILKIGILSKKAAHAKDIALGFNYGMQTKSSITNGYNGDEFISCARSPVHDDAAGYSGAFNYIKKGIAFAISGVSGVSEHLAASQHHSGIAGEAFVSWSIDPTNIVGVVISEELIRKKIRDLNFLEGGAYGTFHLRCKYLAEYLKTEYDIEDSQLQSQVELQMQSTLDDRLQNNDMAQLEERYNQLIKSCIAKQIDINAEGGLVQLIRISAPHLKLFDSKGFEIGVGSRSEDVD